MTPTDRSPELPGPLVDARWLASHRDPSLVVLDATVVLPPPLSDGEFRAENGYPGFLEAHIPGARHADLLDHLSDPRAPCHFAHPSAPELARALEELDVLDRTSVVTYDTAGGIWAARLWWMLRWIDVPAAVLDGGLQAWIDEGGELERGPGPRRAPELRARRSEVTERPGSWVDRTEVERIATGSDGGALICALSAEVFEGEVPTRYRRRGHIPGSVNVPARDLLGPSGRLLDREALQRATAPARGAGPVAVYCGCGISAAVVALALTVQGREEVAIYDGSLEEWSANPSLPLELGPASARGA